MKPRSPIPEAHEAAHPSGAGGVLLFQPIRSSVVRLTHYRSAA
jgi:hypothetical protein